MLMISEETLHLFCFVIIVHTLFAPVNKNHVKGCPARAALRFILLIFP